SGHARLDVVGRVADAGRRPGHAGALGAGVYADDQAGLLAGAPDRVVEAVAIRHARAGAEHDRLDLPMPGQAVCVVGGLVRVVGRDRQRDDEALVTARPVLERPVVEGAAERGRVVRVGDDRGRVGVAAGQERTVDVPDVEVYLLERLVVVAAR